MRSVDLPILQSVRTKLFSSEPFHVFEERLSSLFGSGLLTVRGVHGSLLAFLASFLSEKRASQILIVVAENDRAEKLRDDIALLQGDARVRLFTRSEHREAKLLDLTASIAGIETLTSLSKNEKVIVVASAEGIVQQLPPPQQMAERILHLQSQNSYSFTNLLQTLQQFGFERKDFVEGYGDFAVRGGILDVFPFVGEHPYRIEFWGDTIDSIREFDVLSQRSMRVVESMHIVPNLAASINGTPVSLAEYLQNDALVLLDEPPLIEKECDELIHEGVTNLFEWKELNEQLRTHPSVVHSSLISAESDLDFQSSPQPPFGGKVKLLYENLIRLSRDRYDLFLACDTKEEAGRIRELLEEERTLPSTPEDDEASVQQGEAFEYHLMHTAFHSGFLFPPAKLALFTEHEVFGRLKRRGLSKRKAFRGLSEKEYRQLHRGDFVVHEEYGIGRFAGLQKIRVRGVEQEVMKLEYAERDALYVNLDFIHRVQKYSSQEGHVPQLSKLGTPQWERLKARAKKRIKDIARDLIKLYARRKHEAGHAFSPDTHWQKEMEAAFMYEDTPDQARATLDVKADMENSAPMDRLICGDVGFGKTEVAVRAAFKAVMDGKQVALLVPTTILAAQHFNTFTDRLGSYPVRIASLTRFKTTKEQKKIVEDVSAGHVDILIGTHRILSKDVAFKNLGLLVIDEEHRFGVSAKEKLRQMKASVDTLTLTATPIPRTLQFSLLGARDLSIINTAPRNRLPIITEIAQFDLQFIREAILKELHRGGQVYVIHDRVQNIEDIQRMLHEKIPEARFHVAHGQMPGHELEKTMMNFLDRKYDVLLCTKIIESGIDIPSVNTIIINRADRFGLAELYQLRGRVGRSNVQAYALLLTPPLAVLPKHTLRRLQAIQEFTELGSGFNLAMRDLEIRGAGNLLGGEQSGFVLEMGFEMYQKIVEEAVGEIKLQEFTEVFGEGAIHQKPKGEIVIETDVESLIPEIYVESDTERLDVYRRLYKADNEEETSAIGNELRDRFGEYPEEVENLLTSVKLKLAASRLGIKKVEISGDLLTLHCPPSDDTWFYENGENGEGTFQVIMNATRKLKSHHPQWKQDGATLKLRLRFNPSEHDKLAAALQLVKELGRVEDMTGEKEPPQ